MKKEHPPKYYVNRMMAGDAFSQWLKLEVVEVHAGYCQCRMKVREEMLNGFDILHGGIAFALADSTLAFAANTHGRQAVAMQASIIYSKPVRLNAILISTAKEVHLGNKTATYDISIHDQEQHPVAHFRGMVFRKGEWDRS